MLIIAYTKICTIFVQIIFDIYYFTEKDKILLKKKYIIFLAILTIFLCTSIVSANNTTIENNTHTIHENNTITKHTNITNTKQEDTKIKPNITIENTRTKTHTNTTIKAQLPKDAKGNVVIKLNSKTISNKLKINNGQVTYTFKPTYSSKNYTITLVYSGDNKYSSATKNATLTLDKLNVKTIIQPVTGKQNKNTRIIVQVIDELNNPVKTKVAYKINGKTIGVNSTDNRGYAQLNYIFGNPYNKNRNILSITTGQTSYQSTSTTTNNFTILKEPKINIKGFTTTTGSKVQIYAQIKDNYNKNINTGYADIYLNNIKIGRTRVANSSINYTYQLPLISSGKHNLSIKYLENNVYDEQTSIQSIQINKLTTRINSSNIKINSGKRGTYEVKILDKNNNTVKNGTAIVYVNNRELTRKTIVNGKINYTYTAPVQYSSSIVNFRIIYNGNNIYEASQNTGNITIESYNRVYVSPYGNDNNTGNNTHPFRTINRAVRSVYENGSIYLSPGEYKESGMIIYKSFTINGLSRRENVVINLEKQSNILFYIINQNKTLNINNITIKNSNIQNKNFSSIIVNAGTLNINNALFTNNYINTKDGSCIYNFGKTDIRNSAFTNNIAQNTNGGTIKSYKGNINIYNTIFNNNQVKGDSLGGGAIYATNTRITINNSQFIGNKVLGNNANGGAIKIVLSPTTIQNSKLINNSVEGKKQQIGGAICSLNSDIKSIKVLYEENKAISDSEAFGGAIFNQNARTNIISSVIYNNQIRAKNTYGAGMFLYNSTINIESTNFYYNKAFGNTNNGISYGGALYTNLGTMNMNKNIFNANKASAKTAYAGAVYTSTKSVRITYTKFSNNIADGTSSSAGALLTTGNTRIERSNFTANKALGKYNGGGAITNTGTITVLNSNLINNQASKGGYYIFNSGKIGSINYNYWGARYPSWTKLLYKASKPSRYYKTLV